MRREALWRGNQTLILGFVSLLLLRRWNKTIEARMCARRGIGLHLRSTAGCLAEPFWAQLHQSRGVSIGSRYCLLVQLRPWRVSFTSLNILLITYRMKVFWCKGRGLNIYVSLFTRANCISLGAIDFRLLHCITVAQFSPFAGIRMKEPEASHPAL